MLETKLNKEEFTVSYIDKANIELNNVYSFINNPKFNLTNEQKEAVVSYAFVYGMLMAEDIEQLGVDAPYFE